ncbi:MAG: S-adenosylmethionine decarboxylase [Sphaerospermopsis sp. SIO1G1]|nr:S-adenosylmethionine decarboxylase [Sphaerospermopsis sp. SIO1G1]
MIISHHFSAILPVKKSVFNWRQKDFLEVLKDSADTSGLTVVGELAYTFQPQGVSAVVLLSESHIALHFWPEESKITIDIHICDYQNDNLTKAKLLTQILTQEISSLKYLYSWKYTSIT